MIQVTRRGTEFSGSAEALADLRAQFEREHYFRLPKLLEPSLLEVIQREIERGEFHERIHERIGPNKELCMSGNTGFGALLFLINDEKLFRVIEDVARCARIRSFEGRVYRVNSGPEYHDSWHNDIGEDRLVGMSINLSTETYKGGVLQIRDHDSREIISEVPNTGVGDAIVFRLARSLQHRITEIAGDASKTAFAGWFRAQPDVSSLFKEFYKQPAGAELQQMSFPVRTEASISSKDVH